MPHDAKGNPLEVGDKVVVLCSVREVYEGEEACNVSVEPLPNPEAPREYRPTITMNSRFVEKAEFADVED